MLDFRGRCALEEELHSLLQVVPRSLDGVALAGDVQLGTEAYITFTFAMNDRSRLMNHGDLSKHVPCLSAPILLELAVERPLADTQKPRGLFAVAAGKLQGLGDVMPLDFLK